MSDLENKVRSLANLASVRSRNVKENQQVLDPGLVVEVLTGLASQNAELAKRVQKLERKPWWQRLLGL